MQRSLTTLPRQALLTSIPTLEIGIYILRVWSKEVLGLVIRITELTISSPTLTQYIALLRHTLLSVHLSMKRRLSSMSQASMQKGIGNFLKNTRRVTLLTTTDHPMLQLLLPLQDLTHQSTSVQEQVASGIFLLMVLLVRQSHILRVHTIEAIWSSMVVIRIVIKLVLLLTFLQFKLVWELLVMLLVLDPQLGICWSKASILLVTSLQHSHTTQVTLLDMDLTPMSRLVIPS